MTSPERESQKSLWPMLAALGAIVVCCAGPAILVALASTGAWIAIVRSGSLLVGGAAVAAALVIAALAWRRWHSCANS